jgi:hypothetical protein
MKSVLFLFPVHFIWPSLISYTEEYLSVVGNTAHRSILGVLNGILEIHCFSPQSTKFAGLIPEFLGVNCMKFGAV